MNIESLFRISYGMYIVGASDGKKLNGYISNTVFQVTAAPPQLAVACSKNNFSAALISASGAFAVSVLRTEFSPDLMGRFGYKSGRDIEKFTNTPHIIGGSGSPIVTQDTLAWFDCRVNQTVDAGSHLLFIGEITDSQLTGLPGDPLTYAWYREVKKGKAPANAPTFVDEQQLRTMQEAQLQNYYCTICGHIYNPAIGDPAHGIEPGTAFDDLPDDWACPVCGADQEDFAPKK